MRVRVASRSAISLWFMVVGGGLSGGFGGELSVGFDGGFGGVASRAFIAKAETFRHSRFLWRGECWAWRCGFTVRLHG